jgi:peptide/nickel transport system permease protein
MKHWLRRHHPLTLGATAVLLALYGMVTLADVLAPYTLHWADRNRANAPPTWVYVLACDARNRLFVTWPYVFAYRRHRHPATLETQYVPDVSQRYPLRLFQNGRLLSVDAPARLNLLGTDQNGRDLFSRLLFGGRISLTVGFLGLLVSVPVGLLVGGLAGYVGGWLDAILMRVAEVMMSIPSLYLLVGLAALLPAGVSSTQRFALVTILLAVVGWAGLARVVRGMVLSLKLLDYVEAARALGAGTGRLLWRHILPQTSSYVLVALTIGVPGYILAESGLSFLGLGIQQPDASWGNLLKEAQDINNLLYAPWMLAPGLLIFIAVLAFNVVGDAVRDALDPKSRQQAR